MSAHKVGGEVDSFCTKCRMTLAHTILAMVGTKIARVRCNTCNGDHVPRTEAGSAPVRSAAPRPSRSAEEKPAKVVIGFEQQLASKDLSRTRPYNMKETFAVDDVVNHPSFGLGIVTAVRGDKMDITFKATEKTLVHARGGAPAARPEFARPAAVATGPADKPLSELAAAPAQRGEIPGSDNGV